MPVNQKMMKDMKKRYGAKKGKDVYYAVEAKNKATKKEKSKK